MAASQFFSTILPYLDRTTSTVLGGCGVSVGCAYAVNHLILLQAATKPSNITRNPPPSKLKQCLTHIISFCFAEYFAFFIIPRLSKSLAWFVIIDWGMVVGCWVMYSCGIYYALKLRSNRLTSFHWTPSGFPAYSYTPISTMSHPKAFRIIWPACIVLSMIGCIWARHIRHEGGDIDPMILQAYFVAMVRGLIVGAGSFVMFGMMQIPSVKGVMGAVYGPQVFFLVLSSISYLLSDGVLLSPSQSSQLDSILSSIASFFPESQGRADGERLKMAAWVMDVAMAYVRLFGMIWSGILVAIAMKLDWVKHLERMEDPLALLVKQMGLNIPDTIDQTSLLAEQSTSVPNTGYTFRSGEPTLAVSTYSHMNTFLPFPTPYFTTMFRVYLTITLVTGLVWPDDPIGLLAACGTTWVLLGVLICMAVRKGEGDLGRLWRYKEELVLPVTPLEVDRVTTASGSIDLEDKEVDGKQLIEI